MVLVFVGFFWSNDKESSLVTSVRFYTVEILAAEGTNGGATIPRYAERCVHRDQNDVLKKKKPRKSYSQYVRILYTVYGFCVLILRVYGCSTVLLTAVEGLSSPARQTKIVHLRKVLASLQFYSYR